MPEKLHNNGIKLHISHILKGQAKASNIFWQVGSSVTFGTTTVFKGTVLALQAITFNTGASLDGADIASNGEVYIGSRINGVLILAIFD